MTDHLEQESDGPPPSTIQLKEVLAENRQLRGLLTRFINATEYAEVDKRYEDVDDLVKTARRVLAGEVVDYKP